MPGQAKPDPSLYARRLPEAGSPPARELALARPGLAVALLGLPWPGHALHASSGVAVSDLAWLERFFLSQLGLQNPPKSTPVLTCLDLS